MKKYVGIDVSKRDFHACFNGLCNIKKFDNSHDGILGFLTYLKIHKFSCLNTLIGLESTGSYHLQLSFLATKAGYTVNVINPLITRKQNKAAVRSVKTDLHDASLVRICTINGAGHPFRDTETSLVLKTLVRQRSKFAMLRLHAVFRQEEVNLRESYINNEISKANGDLVKFLDEKIKFLDRRMAVFEPELQKLLRSIPGIGPQTAATCIAEIGDIHRFPNPKTLTAYIGLDSRVYESGTSRQRLYYQKRQQNITYALL